MLRITLALLALASSAVAAPVPKDKDREQIEKLYGKIVDPKGDSKFTLDGKKLKITLPADKVRDLSHEVDTAPRIVREVKGNFLLTVRIETPLNSQADLADEMKSEKLRVMFLAGGIQMKTTDEKDGSFRYGFSRYHSAGEKVVSGCPFELPPRILTGKIGATGHVGTVGLEGEALTLKYTRKGDKVSVVYSTDGKKWQGGVDVGGFTEKESITINLFAQHASASAHTVTFSEFDIKPVEKK